MPLLTWKNISVNVDDDGFLSNPEDWSEEIASLLAKEEKILLLTVEHWKVIHFLRDFNKEFGITPMIRKICNETEFNLKKIYELFPSGVARCAFKIAGLTKHPECY